MKIILDYLGKDYSQTIILIVTVIATVLIYFFQKWAERRNAARSIIIQIDIMDGRVELLSRCINYDATTFDGNKFWQSEDITEDYEWNRYRQLFVKKLNYNEIVAINQYFDNLALIARQQKEVKRMIIDCMKKSQPGAELTINVPSLLFQTILSQKERVVAGRATLPYEKLKNIAKMQ